MSAWFAMKGSSTQVGRLKSIGDVRKGRRQTPIGSGTTRAATAYAMPTYSKQRPMLCAVAMVRMRPFLGQPSSVRWSVAHRQIAGVTKQSSACTSVTSVVTLSILASSLRIAFIIALQMTLHATSIELVSRRSRRLLPTSVTMDLCQSPTDVARGSLRTAKWDLHVLSPVKQGELTIWDTELSAVAMTVRRARFSWIWSREAMTLWHKHSTRMASKCWVW
mmetsp:Transcript_42792/g.98084  ORF Transcript_42792/g.98084 Transcript_42792/m.98084 type:complete len:220 (+) Transcript_42792:738-1397(+)